MSAVVIIRVKHILILCRYDIWYLYADASWEEDQTPTYCTEQYRYREILLPPTVEQFWGKPERRVAVADRNVKTSCHRCSADSCQNTQQCYLQPHWSLKQSPLFHIYLLTVLPGFTVEEPWYASRDRTERDSSYSHWIKEPGGGGGGEQTSWLTVASQSFDPALTTACWKTILHAAHK